jgi:Ca-activated chloride channel family protein
MSIAAAGPASLAPAAAVDKLGMHVVFAIDVSPSMAARDLEPSRLEAAKSFVGAFLSSPDGAAGASVGLVAFGAEAALACPPTTDYATVLERLESLQPGVLGDGTALGQGLASAYRQIVASGSRRAVAVLLSDGEDNVGLVHPEDAAKALRGGGVRFLVVGVGSKGDVPIDYVNPVTGQRMSGEYRSGFDSDAMAAIAAAGGGDYRAAPDARSLSGLVKELGESSLAATEPYLLDDPLGVGGGRVAGRGAASSAPRRPYGRILALISMGLAAAAWAVWRLVFGGLL